MIIKYNIKVEILPNWKQFCLNVVPDLVLSNFMFYISEEITGTGTWGSFTDNSVK